MSAFGTTPVRGDRAGLTEGGVTTEVSASPTGSCAAEMALREASPTHQPLAVSDLGRLNLGWGRAFQ